MHPACGCRAPNINDKMMEEELAFVPTSVDLMVFGSNGLEAKQQLHRHGVFGLLHAPRKRRSSTCSSPPSRTCSNTLLRVRVDVIMSIFANMVTHILFGVVVFMLLHSHVGIRTPSWIVHKACPQFAWLRVEGRLLCPAKAIL